MSFRNFYRTLGMMQWQGIKILVLRSVDLQLHSLYPYIIICYNAKAGIKIRLRIEFFSLVSTKKS